MQAARNAVVGHSTVASLNRDSRALFAKCGALMKDGLRIKTIPFSDCVRFLSLTPIDSNVYNDTIILYCGRRYFLRERKPMIPQIRSDNFNPSVKNLLPKSFRDLQFEVDDEIKVKSSLFQTQLQRSFISNEQESNGLGNAPQLWVDKYSPQSFTQLLSVEKTNREVLKAVKRWDRYVFKIPPIADSSAKGTAGNEQAASLSLYAEDGRPRQKVCTFLTFFTT